MNLEDLTLADMKAAETATERFGDSAKNLEYVARPNGFTTFVRESAPGGLKVFQYYWFDPSRAEWRQHHITKDEPWL